jgi:GNAT superfamily N-acetyltransferase
MRKPNQATVHSVTSPRELRDFARFPWHVYRDDPSWVPPVLAEREALLDRHRNPFFQQGEAELFLARRAGQTVGTIAVGIDPLANAHRVENVAFFGLFETIEDEDVARTLLGTAQRWAKAHGTTALRGPFDLSSAQPGGLLVEGHDCPPVVLTGHTPAYYATFVERFGFRTWGADHLAYRLDLAPFQGDPARVPAKLIAVAERAAQKPGVRVRAARLSDWPTEIELIRTIYNESLAPLSDFVPVGSVEFARQGEALRAIVDPELILIVEVDGRAVGFLVALPDINQALRHGGGLRNPWDYVKVWWHRRRIDCVSLKIVAVLPAYQSTGLGSLLYLELAKRLLRKSFRWVDLSLTGEDNPQTNRIAAVFGATIYKRYRTYELALNGMAAEDLR